MLKPIAFSASAAAFLSLFSVVGCDFAPLGKEKQIASGYRLRLSDDGSFAVFAPGVDAGAVITQIGWRRPFIIAATDEDVWQVFDTSSREFPPFLKAEQVRADPRLSDIPLLPVEVAWERLSESNGHW